MIRALTLVVLGALVCACVPPFHYELRVTYNDGRNATYDTYYLAGDCDWERRYFMRRHPEHSYLCVRVSDE